MVMWSKPRPASWRTITSRIGYSPIGIRGLGSTTVYGRNRVPRPPARITARLDIVQVRLVPLQVAFVQEPCRGPGEPVSERHLRGETAGRGELGVVAPQP